MELNRIFDKVTQGHNRLLQEERPVYKALKVESMDKIIADMFELNTDEVVAENDERRKKSEGKQEDLLSGIFDRMSRIFEHLSQKKDAMVEPYKIKYKIIELEQLKKVLREIKYILAMDMGCGSTSGAMGTITGTVVPVSWTYKNVYIDDNGEVKTEDHANPQLHIPTILGYDSDNEICVIGPAALDCMGDVAENFKDLPIPSRLKELILKIWRPEGDKLMTRREVWQEYFKYCGKSMMEELREKFTDATAENTLFVVAHPASKEWVDPVIRQEYRQMIANGTGFGVSHIITISEALSCMQYIRKQREGVVLGRGVLMVDIGASTIDIGFLSGGCTSPRECSISLAGRDVDRLIANRVLAKWYPDLHLSGNELPDESFFVDHGCELGTRGQFLYSIRLFKEEICNDNDPGKVYTLRRLDKQAIFEMAGNDLLTVLEQAELTVRCDDTEMAAFIKDKLNDKTRAANLIHGSFYDILEEMIRFQMQCLENAGFTEISNCIVTGGSCRLVGMKDHMIKITGNKDPILMNEPDDYEQAVPKGSLWYLLKLIGKDYIDGSGKSSSVEYMTKFTSQLQDALNEDISNLVADTLVPQLMPLIEEKIRKQLSAWENTDDDYVNGAANLQKSADGLKSLLKNEAMINIDELSGHTKNVQEQIRNGKFSEDATKKSREVCNALLARLSAGKFGGKVSFSGFSFELQASAVKTPVNAFADYLNAKNRMDWIDKINNGWHHFWDNLPADFISDFARKWIVISINADLEDATSSISTKLKDSLHEQIKKQVGDAFRKNNGFGIAQKIIDDMIDQIRTAMYII